MPHLSRLTPLAMALALLVGSPLIHAAQESKAAAPAAAAPAPAPGKAPLPLDELRTFAEVLDRIKSAYVEPVDDKTLLENAIKGMLSNLDPHSAYLEPEAFRSCRKAPAVNSAAWASKWAPKTASSRSSRPSTTPPPPRPASSRAT